MQVYIKYMSRIIFSCIIVVSLSTTQLFGKPTVDKLPFSVGEKLNFKVYLGFIFGGNAIMSVKSIEDVDGYPCYKIVSEARSTRTVDMFYKVRDRIISWRDVEKGFSRRFEKHVREGRYKTYKRVEYSPEDSTALLYRNSRKHPDTLDVPGLVFDILSAFYQVRIEDLEVGKSILIDVHDIKERYNLEVEVLRKERLKVPAGEFDCIVVEPYLQSAGIFRREGRMQIWLTDDEYNEMKLHPLIGAQIVKGISFLEPVIPYVLEHHERFDGKGYPRGVGENNISIKGRILAVADTLDAMTSDRPYRQAFQPEDAFNEILRNRGTQFDPEVVRAFKKAWRAGKITISR